MYEFMCIVWQLVGSLVGLMLLVSLIYSIVSQFRAEEDTDDDD